MYTIVSTGPMLYSEQLEWKSTILKIKTCMKILKTIILQKLYAS